MKKLLLIDGMAVVYRAYFALNHNPRVNSKGMNTSCVLGFATTLFDLLQSQKPTHIAIAFDIQKPTFRHQLFPEYKANREAMPEEIQIGLPWVRKIIDAFRIPVITCEGYEADDVIGTLSHEAEIAGFDHVVMATPDKDFAQLVTPVVNIYRFGRAGKPDSLMGVNEVLEKFEVSSPSQVIDLLGLWGDAVDNIPGIRGVGEKTAKKLISQFGSIEQMVAHSDEIKNDRVRRMVQEHADDALFSKQLATIRLDAPIPFNEDQLLLSQPDYQQLRVLCDELEFRQFARRVIPSTVQAAPSAPANQTTPPDSPRTASQTSLFEVDHSEADIPSLTTSPLTADILESLQGHDIAILFQGPTIALSIEADKVWTTTVDQLDHSLFAQILSNPDTLKLCYDIKTLKYLCAELGAKVNGRIFDAQLAHYLLDADMRHSLDFIVSSFLGYEPTDLPSQVASLWQLYPLMAARLKDADLLTLYTEVELPLVDVLIDMENAGIRIDVKALSDYSERLEQERGQIEQQIYQLVGSTFNINSSKQLGQILFEQLKITDRPPRTATKQYSTAEDVLQKLVHTHPVVPLILEHRSLNKLISTYLEPLPRLISPVDGRLHTLYNQTVAATGRLSSSNPNLQNIPVRTQRGREIRRAFVPADSEHSLLAADYSQIELRIIASLSHDQNLLLDFNNRLDIHAATAARIFHIPIEQVSSDQRRRAKSVNFGIVYGISPFGLAAQLDIPRKEAATLIDDYFAHYPAVAQYIEQSKDFARQHGYARTLLGRRRYLPDINSRNASARGFAERNAVNMPVQGTSADMIKLAMIRIHQQLTQRHLASRMLLQVHDELLIDLFHPEEEEVKQIVLEQMQQALPLDGLEVEVSIGIANNWLDAH